jgi:hypothetical protein
MWIGLVGVGIFTGLLWLAGRAGAPGADDPYRDGAERPAARISQVR